MAKNEKAESGIGISGERRQMYVQNHILVQGDQLYLAVCFWYLVKSDLSGLHAYSSVHWTCHFLQGT